jgi:broad specificity phosphatase PhoE
VAAGTAAWPRRIFLARHAESIGNLARVTAEANGEELIDIAERDMDVPLSPTGELQARALGRWLGAEGRPTAIYASPYVRAAETARLACEEAGIAEPLQYDERLREREFGVLDRLTRAGIEARFPAEAEARGRVGKFYYRPPGGESWCDVALRVRSVIDSVGREHADGDLLVVTHEVVVMVFRYVLERLTEAEVLGLSTERELANCSITEYRVSAEDGARPELVQYDFVPEGMPVTAEPDVARAPR